jgi:hypothetical protein
MIGARQAIMTEAKLTAVGQVKSALGGQAKKSK